jgi:phosphotransferase system  glucose/maltose/N-acetylglucosamine-specific IIC component
VTVPSLETLGRWILIFGVAVVVVGGLIWALGKFTRIQDLPGTLKFEFSGVTCIVPILASIVISILLTVVLNLVIRGLNR